MSGLSQCDTRRVLICCALRVKSEGCGRLSILSLHSKDRVKGQGGIREWRKPSLQDCEKEEHMMTACVESLALDASSRTSSQGTTSSSINLGREYRKFSFEYVIFEMFIKRLR